MQKPVVVACTTHAGDDHWGWPFSRVTVHANGRIDLQPLAERELLGGDGPVPVVGTRFVRAGLLLQLGLRLERGSRHVAIVSPRLRALIRALEQQGVTVEREGRRLRWHSRS